MTLKLSTLSPGFLVSLKTSVRGNVSYERTDLDVDVPTDDGVALSRWETRRMIADPAEHDRAIKARSKIRSLITSVCVPSSFGLMCPEGRAKALDQAIADARRAAADFNEEAAITSISVYVLAGRIASDDAEAVRAINGEVRELLEAMRDGVANLDVQAVRSAAARARDLRSMLSPFAAVEVQQAIETARAAARRISQAGEQAAVEVDRVAVAKLEASRTAFLDLDDAREVAAPEAVAPAVDLAPAEATGIAEPAAPVPALDLE